MQNKVTWEEPSSPPQLGCLAPHGGDLQALGNGSHGDLFLLLPLSRPLTIVQSSDPYNRTRVALLQLLGPKNVRKLKYIRKLVKFGLQYLNMYSSSLSVPLWYLEVCFVLSRSQDNQLLVIQFSFIDFLAVFLCSDASSSKAGETSSCFNCSCLFCRSLLNQYKEQLGLDSRRIPRNAAVNGFAEALAKAWEEYSNPRLDLTDRTSFL